MKKVYQAPEADLLCFRPVEELAANLGNMLQLPTVGSGRGEAAETSETDIKVFL